MSKSFEIAVSANPLITFHISVMIETRIEATMGEIEVLTAQLAQERQIRLNKEEYNRMAGKIMLLPPRAQLEASIGDILRETEQLALQERQIQAVIGEERAGVAVQLEGLAGCLNSIETKISQNKKYIQIYFFLFSFAFGSSSFTSSHQSPKSSRRF